MRKVGRAVPELKRKREFGPPIKVALARRDGLSQHLVQLPGRASLNVAVAGSIVLYDWHVKAVRL